MATAAIKPSAEAACRLCRGRAVKTESQWLKAEKVLRSPRAPQNRIIGAKRQVPLTGGGFRGRVTHGIY